ncbi:carboxymuconolactone decarboxylase family protein [Falsiroseomonas sp. HW251]|uniref:carboxymuconolactone decarboxylase family protein n=1 Tax=Falsiroseomonas sp. HW251 TaxID=3390998 RepID=UPI003D324396
MTIVDDEHFERGMKLLTEMGREKTMRDHKQLSEDLYRYSVGFLFGEIWQRPGLSLRDRQLITLAANIAMSRPTGSHSHFRSAKKIGMTHEEIMEVIIHVGMYTGWPCMSHAVKQYLEVLQQDPTAQPWAAEQPPG